MKKRIFKISIILGVLGIFAETVSSVASCEWTDPSTWGKCILSILMNLLLPHSALEPFVNGLKTMILWNPSLSGVNNLIVNYISLLQPVFVLLLVVSGFYLTLMSGSPAGRSRAKSLFWKLLIVMILVSLSLDIFELLVAMSEALSRKILAEVNPSVTPLDVFPITYALMAIVGLFLTVFGIIPILISLGARWILLLIMAALFPLALLFSFLDLPVLGSMTKEIGMKMLRYSLAVIFAQPVQALMLAITITAYNSIGLSFSGFFIPLIMLIAGLIAITAAPLIVLGVMRWIGGAFMLLGLLAALKGNIAASYAATTIGGIMMGQGPSSLLAAGGTATFGLAARRMRSAHGAGAAHGAGEDHDEQM